MNETHYVLQQKNRSDLIDLFISLGDMKKQVTLVIGDVSLFISFSEGLKMLKSLEIVRKNILTK